MPSEEDKATGSILGSFVQFGHVVFEMQVEKQTDKQTNKQIYLSYEDVGGVCECEDATRKLFPWNSTYMELEI